MADFWGGFGKGFAPSFETAWESASESSAEASKVELAAKTTRAKNAAAAIKAFEQIKQAGGDPKSILPQGAVLAEGKTTSDWVKTASNEDLLSSAGRATPLVSELQRVRTQTQAREKQTDTLRGAEWTDPISGELRIKKDHLKTYPKGGRRHDNLLLGSGDFYQKLSEPAKQRLANSGGPADELRKQIAHLTGSDMPSFYDLTPQEQAADVTVAGMERLRKLRNGVAGYLERYKKPLTFDLLKGEEKANLIESIRKNQGEISEGGLAGDDLTKAKNLTRAMRIRLASLVGETEFTVEKLERKIKEFDDADAAEKDMDEFVWKAGQTKALARVADFRKYIKPVKFSNKKYEHEIMVGEGEDRDDLYDKTYFEKVYLPGSKDRFYLDVKNDFRRWIPTFRQTIPQFVGGKEFTALNPTGALRSIIYLPPQVTITTTGIPPGGADVDVPGPEDAHSGTPGYDVFWKERPEMLGTGAIERQKIRAKYNVGLDGDIEAPAVPVPAAPKVFEETPDLKKVPRRGERERVPLPREPMEVARFKEGFEDTARYALKTEDTFRAIIDKIADREEREQLKDELRAAGKDEEKALRIMMRVLKSMSMEGK